MNPWDEAKAENRVKGAIFLAWVSLLIIGCFVLYFHEAPYREISDMGYEKALEEHNYTEYTNCKMYNEMAFGTHDNNYRSMIEANRSTYYYCDGYIKGYEHGITPEEAAEFENKINQR